MITIHGCIVSNPNAVPVAADSSITVMINRRRSKRVVNSAPRKLAGMPTSAMIAASVGGAQGGGPCSAAQNVKNGISQARRPKSSHM
jgi:hypothetical protein